MCPVAVETLEVREGDHVREVGKQGLWVVIPEFHIRVIEKAFQNRAGDVWCLITCTKKESNEGKDHFLAKLLVEEEHAEHDSDGYEAEDGHGVFDYLQDSTKLLDVGGELFHQRAGENVRPEAILALAERDLELDILM